MIQATSTALSNAASSLRLRKTATDMEGAVSTLPPDQQITFLSHQNNELDILNMNLRKMLELSRHRERKMAKMLDEAGIGHHMDDPADKDDLEALGDSSFTKQLLDRSVWLIGLLIFQSLSSFILRSNEELLQKHPIIVYFLTMLVGAGGNAGNQATVRAIRGIALGSLNKRTAVPFILKEFMMAITLSVILGFFGFLRVYLLSNASMHECVAISLALVVIVLSSIVIGALLPIVFQMMGVDPAHSSTSIQVIMDISGVIITCFISTTLLDRMWATVLTDAAGSGIGAASTSLPTLHPSAH